MSKSSEKIHVVLVTGQSGAGRTTAIHALEDNGFEVIDNLPISLMNRLLDGDILDRKMALGVDIRNRDFSPEALIALIQSWSEVSAINLEVLYLDSSPSALLKRYTETRRRHPSAPTTSPLEGITTELETLRPIRGMAHALVDTTNMSPHDLRANITHRFGADNALQMAISVQSFSYKRGLPRSADVVFDCRFLNNPHWVPELRPMDGTSKEVAEYVRSDKRYLPFEDRIFDYLDLVLPAHVEEGRAHFSIAFGCTGGKHRSVATADRVLEGLAEKGWHVSIRHRELERATQ